MELKGDKEFKYDKLDDDIRRRLLDHRIVLLTGEIGLSLINDVVKELIYISLKSRGPIKIVLNSVGGEVYAGLLLYNTVRDLVRQGIDVEIEVRGLAASMGCIILQSASRRTTTKATRFLIHEVSTWEWGSVTEMEEKVEEVRKVNNMLRDILVERTGHSKKDIDKLWAKKDVWYSADEALRFGLVDAVVG